MSDINQLLLQHIVPGLGCVIAFVMFSSPLKAVIAVQRQRTLGDLNPLPMVAIWANCTAWLMYAYMKADYYVFFANEPGLLLGIYMTIICYGFAEPKTRERILYAVIFFAVLMSLGGALITFGVADAESKLTTWGFITVFILLIFYGAPLSVLAEVLRTRNSVSLFWPLSVMAAVNGCLWMSYGLAVNDAFIWAPNAVGAFFGFVQLVLICTFPARPPSSSSRSRSHEDLEHSSMLNEEDKFSDRAM